MINLSQKEQQQEQQEEPQEEEEQDEQQEKQQDEEQEEQQHQTGLAALETGAQHDGPHGFGQREPHTTGLHGATNGSLTRPARGTPRPGARYENPLRCPKKLHPTFSAQVLGFLYHM